jgi:hypothetical protein
MYVKPTALRSIREVFNDAIRIYKATGRSTWMLAFGLAIVAAIPSLLWQQPPTPALSDNLDDVLAAATALTVPPAVWLSIVIAVPVCLIFFSALIANINGVATGQAVSAGEAIGLGVRLLPRMCALFVLYSCIVAVGLFVLLVPGIYWGGNLQLAFVPLVIEDTGVLQSMAISRRVIKGHWWRAAMLISYPLGIYLAIFLAVMLLTDVLGSIFRAVAAATAVSQLLLLALDTLTAPLFIAALVALYCDLKLRLEHAGLAGRAATGAP